MIPIIDISTKEGKKRLDAVMSRTQLDLPDIMDKVNTIISNVKKDGDKVLLGYAKEFDGASISDLKVSAAEIEIAKKSINSDLLDVIKKAAFRIRDFHERQKTQSWFNSSKDGEFLGQILRPLNIAGIYVPGGKAAYPSSLLMNIIPAQVAGVERIIISTPTQKDGTVNPVVLAAAAELGVSEIYKTGGAGAVAAMTFGTETIPRVDKIVGPGNIYVALAKKSVYGYVDIDSVAGPSEILIIADKTANPAFVAADMLSQAEHDELAAAICVVTDADMSKEIAAEVEKQTANLNRQDIIKKSLDNYGAIIVVKDIDEAIRISDGIAPEHLELCCDEPFSQIGRASCRERV